MPRHRKQKGPKHCPEGTDCYVCWLIWEYLPLHPARKTAPFFFNSREAELVKTHRIKHTLEVVTVGWPGVPDYNHKVMFL